MILALALPSFAQQTSQASDTRPRDYFETGPPSEFFSEADLQEQRNSFAEAFPSFCPGAVVTENRSKADYVVRLSLYEAVVGENATLNYRMAVLQRSGDQVFADSASGSGVDPVMFAREACAAIVYHMDSDTIFMLASQARRRLLRVGFQVTYYVVNKKLDEKTRQILESHFADSTRVMIKYAFSHECFCITDTAGQLDYRFDVDWGPNRDVLTVLDKSGKDVFSRIVPIARELDLFRDACRAILLRESAEVQEKPLSKQ
jgi:hypothetical protein